MSELDLILFSLAVWRVSSLLCHEDGPYAIFRRMREELERRESELFWALLQCVWCTSVWVGTGLIVAWILVPQLARQFAVVMSASAVAIIIQTWIEGRQSEGDD